MQSLIMVMNLSIGAVICIPSTLKDSDGAFNDGGLIVSPKRAINDLVFSSFFSLLRTADHHSNG